MADTLASITYVVAAAFPLAFQVSVTVLPFTDDIRFAGTIGAASAASNARRPDGAGQAASLTPPEKMPGFPAALHVTQLREMLTGTPCASAALRAVVGDAGDGRVGAEVPPQLVTVRRVATAAIRARHGRVGRDRPAMGRQPFLKSG